MQIKHYDAFSNLTTCEETVANRFKYTDQQQDPITQKCYLRARFYNPVIGRFTQEDTMDQANLVNKLIELYNYLIKNDKLNEAKEIEYLVSILSINDIAEEQIKKIKDDIIQKCNVRRLGDVYIKEFKNPYAWWNFLGEVIVLAEKDN